MSLRRFPSQRLTRSRRRVPRALVAVLLGLQALLWGGGSILEAKSAAEALSRYTHVEDQGTTACPPIHSHLDCQICRTLASGAIPVRSRDALLPVSRTLQAPAAVVTVTGGEVCHGPVGPRAPPIL